MLIKHIGKKGKAGATGLLKDFDIEVVVSSIIATPSFLLNIFSVLVPFDSGDSTVHAAMLNDVFFFY